MAFGTAALALTVAGPGMAAALPKRRDLKLHNIHTGEKFDAVYWANGHYVPGAMAEIRRVLRDYRSNTEHWIDPALIDLLVAIRARVQSHEAFEVISGYRSPQTNAMLCETTSGVATNSQHLHGKAIDIRLPGRDLRHLRDAALKLKRGGVGYYPESEFVHVDTGPIRHW